MTTFTKLDKAKKPQETEKSGGTIESQAEHFQDQYPIIDATRLMMEHPLGPQYRPPGTLGCVTD